VQQDDAGPHESSGGKKRFGFRRGKAGGD
jgi:hypothetical protein